MGDFSKDAEAHWQWVRRLLILIIDGVGYLYKTAMVHGYKHGVEDVKRGNAG